MEIFLDTANIEEIKKAIDWGLCDGVTTNPSLVSKEKTSYKDHIAKIADLVDGPVSAEVISTDYDNIIKEAHSLASIAKNIVIKIPINTNGLKAMKTLSSEGISVNTTLVFNTFQALFAAKAGSDYVSPFIGRLDDIGENGLDIVSQILTVFQNYSIDTRVIVASVRHPVHVLESALLGADIVTLPFGVLEKLIKHPLTDIGLERFISDSKKIDIKF